MSHTWLDLPSAVLLPEQWAFCIPSKRIEAWVIVAYYVNSEPLTVQDTLPNIECNLALKSWLSQRPIGQRTLIRGGKKQPSGYKGVAPQVTAEWENVVRFCSQAARFHENVRMTARET